MLPEENKTQEELEQEMNDEEIAELANQQIKKRDNEIKSLKKELAKMKLLSSSEEELQEEKRTKEELLGIIGSNKTNNYDYAQAVCDLCDLEKEQGNPNPMGKDGDKVVGFFKDVIEYCDGDKTKFASVYQAKLGPDDPKVALMYNSRK